MDKTEKHIILYISSNDGSDTRITKEIKTLVKKYDIIFIGVGDEEKFQMKSECKDFLVVKGKRNHPLTILKQYLYIIKTLFQKRSISVHIINEQLMVLFYPIILIKPTVLDVFDSFFLKNGIGKGKLLWLKRIVYWPVNRVIVTDENRKTLMPDFIQHKISVVPNYPFKTHGIIKSNQSSKDHITILFFGWLGESRGGKQAKELLEASKKVKIIMIGWFSDAFCKQLSLHNRVEYLGIMPQEEALKVAARKADYILCLYEPRNLNQINASPNKIYDSIHTYTPVIINSEVKIAKFVQKENIGIVIDNYYEALDGAFVRMLEERLGSFAFSLALIEQYNWNSIEPELISTHQL